VAFFIFNNQLFMKSEKAKSGAATSHCEVAIADAAI
jgi:hypothetical protein